MTKGPSQLGSYFHARTNFMELLLKSEGGGVVWAWRQGCCGPGSRGAVGWRWRGNEPEHVTAIVALNVYVRSGC